MILGPVIVCVVFAICAGTAVVRNHRTERLVQRMAFEDLLGMELAAEAEPEVLVRRKSAA